MTNIPAYISPSHPFAEFFARMIERLGYWRERRRWIGEMRNVATFGRLDETLCDVGITRAELDLLMTGPVDAGRQFEPMAAGAGAQLDMIPPAVLREAEWTCIRCESRSACAHWMRSGEWSGGDSRCPNAELLNAH